MTNLFTPFRFAAHALRNRFVMAPMTRARRPDYVPDAETALYYRQRASAGLIVSEGTPVSPEGQGYIHVPGIWSQEQVEGWRRVTDAVHDEGGAIFAQLWHVGRMSHVSLQGDGGAPVSSTTRPARDPKSMAFILDDKGEPAFAEPSVPRALGTEEVSRVVADFAKAGRHALAAGFDGVEVHAANGYIFEQFFNPVLNDRTDRYGGSVENRVRFALEAVDALIDGLGKDRVGIRLAPFNRQFDMPAYEDDGETYLHLARELEKRGVAYVHLNDNWAAGHSVIGETFLRAFREAYRGTLILAGAMTLDRAQHLVDTDLIDLPAFGQPFISNPDLVERLRIGAPLAEPDRTTYYGGGSVGYTDYPALATAEAVS